MNAKSLLVMMTLIVSFLCLNACHRSPHHNIALSVDKHLSQSLTDSIRSTGVEITGKGEILMVIIPTDCYFNLNTLNLRKESEHNLLLIAQLLQGWMKRLDAPKVKVMAYTDTVFPKKQQKILSDQYAEVIASHLWNEGIPAELIRAQGFGSKYAVADNQHPRSASMNRRVMILVKE